MTTGLAWWMQQIGRVPLLTPAEEIELGHAIQAWRNHPDPVPPGIRRRGERARQRFIRANLRLSVSWVSKRHHRLAPTVSIDDLIQAANEGLMRAVDRFDPERGYRFSTYAYWWIRQGVGNYLDRYGRAVAIPVSHAQQLARLGTVTRDLTAALGRHPTRDELAAAMGVSHRVLADLITNARPIDSLDRVVDPDRTGGSSLGDVIASEDPSLEEQEDREHRAAQAAQLRQLIARLPRQQRRILTAAWGLDGPEQRPGAIAAAEGLTRRQVALILAQAEGTLRGAACQLVLLRVPLITITRPAAVRRRRRDRAAAADWHQLILPLAG